MCEYGLMVDGEMVDSAVLAEDSTKLAMKLFMDNHGWAERLAEDDSISRVWVERID